jgi:superfamily II DNA or RNA helicase
MPTIYDNISHIMLNGIKSHLTGAVRADFCVGYFNIRGWNAIAADIDNLPGALISENEVAQHRTARILIGMQKAPHEEVRESTAESKPIDDAFAKRQKTNLAQEFRRQLVQGVPDSAYKATVATLIRQIETQKVVVKLYLRTTLHAKLYLSYLPSHIVPQVAFLGSSNLTMHGLASQGELNVDITDTQNATDLAKWFNKRWEDTRCIDITAELLAVLKDSWVGQEPTPYEIYLKIAYHLSREARNSDFKIPKKLNDSLFKFQREAVTLAAHHLNKRNGVIIGDVVGLGKTITATAVARIFQEDFDMETLILCPKNLVDMWEGYAHDYSLRAKVVSQSMVTSVLPELRRFRLIIIDESHNLRNDEGKRYRAIKEYITENESKVMLLSATPYNKSFTDLANQLKLFVSEETDLGIRPEHRIQALGGPIQFAARHAEFSMRSIRAFETSEYFEDWQELMRLYLVRRTRSFIKNHYATRDDSNGRYYLVFPDGTRSYFPERRPKAVTFHFRADDQQDQYAKLFSNDMITIIEELDLPRYGLSNYVLDASKKRASKAQQTLLDNLSRAGKRLKGFSRTNLFKRLESSGHAFLLSLERHLLRNCLFLYAIESNQPIPIGTNVFSDIDEVNEDQDSDSFATGLPTATPYTLADYMERAKTIYQKNDITIRNADNLPSDFFGPALRKDLTRDAKHILTILTTAQRWDAQRDQKLNQLEQLLRHTHPHDKVLVFTQYADTARYLGEQLARRGISHSASVTGDDAEPTKLATRFSPRGKQLPSDSELRVLVATDVLSEGQNLQDAHIVVNYDLPWALIRLIQRAGRVDRIGQKSDTILSYSFLPAEGIEQIINLRARLATRIKANAEVIGTDEVFFDGDPVNIADLYNEKSGILDGDNADSEIDLASYALQIWRTAVDANPDLLQRITSIPNWSYTGKLRTNSTATPGVITYGRTADDTDVLTWLADNGSIVSQSQYTILNALHATPHTPRVERPEHHFDLVKQSIGIMQQQMQTMTGTLGKRSGIKYRLYNFLSAYQAKTDNTLFVRPEINAAINDIYQFPIREAAQESLKRQFKTGADDETLVMMVLVLHEEDKLVIRNDDQTDQSEPQLICSMSIMAQE